MGLEESPKRFAPQTQEQLQVEEAVLSESEPEILPVRQEPVFVPEGQLTPEVRSFLNNLPHLSEELKLEISKFEGGRLKEFFFRMEEINFRSRDSSHCSWG